MLVLDRIFDGDDVPRFAMVDLVDQRRERRRLPRAGGAADEHQAARQACERFDVRRQVERGEPRHHRGQAADGGGGPAPFVMQVDAESSEVRPYGTSHRRCRPRDRSAARAAGAPAPRCRRSPRCRAVPPSTARRHRRFAATAARPRRAAGRSPSGRPSVRATIAAERSGPWTAARAARPRSARRPARRRSRASSRSAISAFQQRRVEEASERRHLAEDGEQRAVELRARGERSGKFRAGQELAILQVTRRPDDPLENPAARASASRLRARRTVCGSRAIRRSRGAF